MSSRNERFNASCLSLDGLAKSIDPAKSVPPIVRALAMDEISSAP